MALPDWMLHVSLLLVVAVLLGLLTRRVGLPHTVVLAVVGFVPEPVGREFGTEIPIHGEPSKKLSYSSLSPHSARG